MNNARRDNSNRSEEPIKPRSQSLDTKPVAVTANQILVNNHKYIPI